MRERGQKGTGRVRILPETFGDPRFFSSNVTLFQNFLMYRVVFNELIRFRVKSATAFPGLLSIIFTWLETRIYNVDTSEMMLSFAER